MNLFDLATYLLFLLLFVIIIGGLYLFKIVKVDTAYKKIKTARSNRQACRDAKLAIQKRNITDYFWSNHMRAAWISFGLIFTIALSLSLQTIWTILIAVIVAIITFFFVRFAIRSYKGFAEKAAQALKDFEDEVLASLEKEISFNGDNIQSFTDKDDEFDTKPKIFSFPSKITKVPFPPYEKVAAKQPIIATKKLEFLILSREYFSICKNAATFNLLEPKLAAEKKQCAKVKGGVGECHEHYYSQMRNVEYDNDKECIRIIYYDERDDVEFPCKKAAPNRKPAMKALQEKLRLTERQKLRKIAEHDNYEKILSRRDDEKNEKEDE